MSLSGVIASYENASCHHGAAACDRHPCASLQSVSVTNIPRERGRPVEATADNPAFLGLHFDNDFADDLPDELRKQCPDGKVTGIYAKYESTWYVLVQNRSVTAHGYCVKSEDHPKRGRMTGCCVPETAAQRAVLVREPS